MFYSMFYFTCDRSLIVATHKNPSRLGLRSAWDTGAGEGYARGTCNRSKQYKFRWDDSRPRRIVQSAVSLARVIDRGGRWTKRSRPTNELNRTTVIDISQPTTTISIFLDIKPDRAHTTLYSSSIVNMALSITVIYYRGQGTRTSSCSQNSRNGSAYSIL